MHSTLSLPLHYTPLHSTLFPCNSLIPATDTSEWRQPVIFVCLPSLHQSLASHCCCTYTVYRHCHACPQCHTIYNTSNLLVIRVLDLLWVIQSGVYRKDYLSSCKGCLFCDSRFLLRIKKKPFTGLHLGRFNSENFSKQIK